LQSSLGEVLDDFGVGFSFLNRHPCREPFRRILIQNRHDALEDDRAVVVFLVNEMDRAPTHLDAIGERGLMYPQSIKPFATEGGNERGVNVDDAAAIVRCIPKDLQETC
jgi:hypothetical protein